MCIRDRPTTAAGPSFCARTIHALRALCKCLLCCHTLGTGGACSPGLCCVRSVTAGLVPRTLAA
eukprot:9261155-Alexandrium_andersonii.AAC.1